MHSLNYTICSLVDLPGQIKRQRPTHVVSILDPFADSPKLSGQIRRNHLFLTMHDVDIPDPGGLKGNPNAGHVTKLFGFAIHLPMDANVIFHCVAGKRRSTAAAMICDLAQRTWLGAVPTPQLIQDCADLLLSRRPKADPNRALLSLADDAIGFGGLLKNHQFSARYLDLSQDD